MALATNIGLAHLPLGERPEYGQPYPEGIAIGTSNVADDASGGAHSFVINADPGFLYRLELVNWTRGEATLRALHVLTVHRWAAGRAGPVLAALDLNWIMLGAAATTFTVYILGAGSSSGVDGVPLVSRLPMGPAGGGAPGVSTQLMLLTNDVNNTGITNEVTATFTYWRKQALFLPGFLSSFYEAPAVPPLIR